MHRTRPILLTAAAASLALIPISHEVFWGPMAYAMMGGIIAGTLLTLVFLPGPLRGLVPHQGARRGQDGTGVAGAVAREQNRCWPRRCRSRHRVRWVDRLTFWTV